MAALATVLLVAGRRININMVIASGAGGVMDRFLYEAERWCPSSYMGAAVIAASCAAAGEFAENNATNWGAFLSASAPAAVGVRLAGAQPAAADPRFQTRPAFGEP